MKALITAALLAMTAPAHADDCTVFGDLAEQIMISRQNEVPISRVMTVSEDPGIRKMILLAYERPSMRVPANQKRQIAQFRNDVEAACYGVRK